eukprot:10021405-Alexandrium_andersonii.AAC.1
MSASLVGSEMCIRDSTWARPKSRVCLPAIWGRPKNWGCPPAIWVRPKTVSYTHLTLPTICSV